jgi:predicted AlkP superfamily phosphohydrolase/phosphomutase
VSGVSPRLLILGWDSATFDVIDPLIDQGRLPVLASLMERGMRAPLRSTWPPMTDCAWTSAFTGCNPGKHGIFGSWYRAPGAYEFRYFSSRDRRAAALWDLAAGISFLVWNVPMTFPPQDVNGAMVAGYGAPRGSRFCSPESLQDSLAERWDLEDLLDRAPYGSLDRYLEQLVSGLRAQAQALPWAIRETAADCAVAVWPHVDRAQHFFWQFRHTDHALSSAVERVYEEMDRTTGAVLQAFPDADVLVVSDHGAGPLQGDINMGAWLARNDYAHYGDSPRSSLGAAWRLPPSTRRLAKRLAPGLARRAMQETLSRGLGSFDWSHTRAFFGVNGDLWINQEGREPQGIVPASAAPALVEDIRAGVLALRDPSSGAPLFAGAHRRSDIYSGPASDLAPDLMLDSWSAGYRIAPGTKASEEMVIPPAPLAGVETSWSSDHRPLGVFVAAGTHVRSGQVDELSLYDVCPTALALLERTIPDGLDGRAAEEALSESFLAAHPVRSGAAVAARAPEPEYSDADAAAVAQHLKELGYIE